jgi:hypothetical protein
MQTPSAAVAARLQAIRSRPNAEGGNVNPQYRIRALCAALLMLAGSASGQTPAVTAPKGSDARIWCVPAMVAGKGRVWIYRTAPKGIGVAPEIVVDGRRYEALLPGTGYRLDVAPGEHQVKLAYDEDVLVVTLDAGQEVFVRFDLDPALFGRGFYPVLVQTPVAQAELREHAGVDFGCVSP